MQQVPSPLNIVSLLLAFMLTALPGHTANLSLADLRPGDLQITEYLANPVVVADSANEYFELFNQREQAVNLNGLIVRDEGSNEFTIIDLVIPGRGFSVLSNGDGSQLGIRPDYQYGSAMALTNSSDEILLLTPGEQLLATLRFSDGDFFGAGVAHELIQGDRNLSEALGPTPGAATIKPHQQHLPKATWAHPAEPAIPASQRPWYQYRRPCGYSAAASLRSRGCGGAIFP